MNSNQELQEAYKRLDIKAYTGIIKDTMIPFFDEYDGEFVTALSPETVFTIEKHYHKDMFMGWNIKANDELLETRDTKRKAKKFLRKLKKKAKRERKCKR